MHDGTTLLPQGYVWDACGQQVSLTPGGQHTCVLGVWF